MNLNEYGEELVQEEQKALIKVVDKMDKRLNKLNKDLQDWIEVAKNADISVNPDLYGTKVQSEDIKKKIKKSMNIINAGKDQLYQTRVLLETENDVDGKDVQEYKIGLHECTEFKVVKYSLPAFRHIIYRSDPEFNIDTQLKNGDVINNRYRVLVKNNLKLRFANVKSVLNEYPNAIDKDILKQIKDNKFFTDQFVDELIENYDPHASNVIDNAKLISDHFLQELLERRSSQEFQNIVFSIQEKQSEIVQLPFRKNIIVQGCAGSGKSMIMLHRLPILLVDNEETLFRSAIYIISPSQAYIQMADNMRRQLEIEDISMGTVNNYYDHAIKRYNKKIAGYDTIDRKLIMPKDKEDFIYSDDCTAKIRSYISGRIAECSVSIDEAIEMLKVDNKTFQQPKTIDQYVQYRIIEINKVLEKNKEVLRGYFTRIREVVDQAKKYSNALAFRRQELIRAIHRLETKEKDKIELAQKALGKLQDGRNTKAIENRNNEIAKAQKKLAELEEAANKINSDDEYFDELEKLHEKIDTFVQEIGEFETDFEKNAEDLIYSLVDKVPGIIGGYYAIEWANSIIESKYDDRASLIEEFEELTSAVQLLETKDDAYLSVDERAAIVESQKNYTKLSRTIIDDTYKYIFESLGLADAIKRKRAYACAPYVYLNIMFRYYGISDGLKESLITIDEAQGLHPIELELMKAVNGGNVFFNLFGDIKQHFEGKAGVDDWGEFENTADFEIYELQENYRNASEITEYCNEIFGMDMNAINTNGNGVHVLDKDDFKSRFNKKLVEGNRAGLSAIIVKDRAEAVYLTRLFSRYKDKFHDMTGDEYDIHRTRWNIMTIDDAKGLEFTTVLALSGRMSENEKYVAYTRALDELYIYDEPVELDNNDTGSSTSDDVVSNSNDIVSAKKVDNKKKRIISVIPPKNDKPIGNAVSDYFESFGLEVIDKRLKGGGLWVIGEQKDIGLFVNAAIEKFGIMGMYTASKESGFRTGWRTKTKK